MSHYPDYPHGRLAPEADALLTDIARSEAPPTWMLTPEQARASFLEPRWSGEPRLLVSRTERRIPGKPGEVPVRIYRPDGDGILPVLVFFHGGGFVLGALADFDAFCSVLAEGARCLVVSVGYRLAPEARHPAAVEDAVAAVHWVACHSSEIGGDPDRIAVGGDSAGGNLAVVSAIEARDRGLAQLVQQVLICPWVDLSDIDSDSFRFFGQGAWLSAANIRWYRGHYLAQPDDARRPDASPLLAARLDGLPRALVINAEFDVLSSQVEAFARRLESSGVEVRYCFHPGMLHDFVTLPGLFPQANEAIEEICSALRASYEAGR